MARMASRRARSRTDPSRAQTTHTSSQHTIADDTTSAEQSSPLEDSAYTHDELPTFEDDPIHETMTFSSLAEIAAHDDGFSITTHTSQVNPLNATIDPWTHYDVHEGDLFRSLVVANSLLVYNNRPKKHSETAKTHDLMHVIHTETRHTQLTDIESYISQRQQITTTNDIHCAFASRHLKRPIHVFNAADNTMRIYSHSETSTQSFKPHPICLLHEPDKAYSVLTHAYLSKYHTGLLYHRTVSAVGSAPQTNTGWDSSTGHRPHNNYALVFSAHTTPSQGSASDTSSSPTSLAGSAGSGTDSENSASRTTDIRDTTLEDDSDIEAPTHAPISNSESHRTYAYRDNPRRFTLSLF